MLNLNGLKKSFPQPGGGRLPVLEIPHFSIQPGEQSVLIGRSGGGKTTLLHLIAGLTTPDEGSIRVGDIELTQLSEAGRDRYRAAMLGYVFQTFNLLPGFTALENVRLGMSFASGRHDLGRAHELLARVGLADRADYRPSQLSVGQQQRVAIARALSSKPKLLLADEPTGSLDKKGAANIADLLAELNQSMKLTLVVVTHSEELADRMEKVYRISEGAISEDR